MTAATAMTSAAAIALIEAAKGPRDIFGDASTDERDARADHAHRTYRRLARLIHPDATASDKRATSAFAKLSALWQQYRAGASDVFASGDIANLIRVPAPQPWEPALLKLARDPADADLMTREAAALRWLAANGDPQFLPYVPRLYETRRYADPGTGSIRRGNVLERLDGFIALDKVRERSPDGLDPRDVAWIWRRVLVAIGFAHRTGLIHGAVLPPHIMIQPNDHGLTLIDWCYSCGGPNPGNLPAAVARYRDWYPPELGAGYAPGEDLDIYLATKSMLALIASPVPGPLAAFAAGCTLAKMRRPTDAWGLLREFDDLIERMWGPRKFRPFPPL
jgi:serine/threonine protein kinase